LQRLPVTGKLRDAATTGDGLVEFYHRKFIAPIALVPAIAAALTMIASAQMASGVADAGGYWAQPLKPQGKPPKNWTALERSLAPADCGQCHAEQFAQWQTSRHAHAFSPGLLGQLLVFDAADSAECLQCHAPLAEQRSAFEAARNGGAQALTGNLAAAGNSCGGCHVRLYRHFGPPERKSSAIGAGAASTPHGGVTPAALFEKSEFCSVCHQFPAALAVNGKPLENTFVEWQASPQAAQNIVCQSCHMPDRRHLWRGIHDPQMVASGLTADTAANADGVRFTITNSGVGHAFPTYAAPKVMMHAVALDADGAPRPDTERSTTIAREVRYEDNHWVELSDTRLLPGQTATVALDWNGNSRIRTWLEVIPDYYYGHEVFPEQLASLPPDSDARRLIDKANTDAAVSSFRLFETELQKP
jgi:hypothetical protein